jgi:hypothetical protein
MTDCGWEIRNLKPEMRIAEDRVADGKDRLFRTNRNCVVPRTSLVTFFITYTIYANMM